MPADGLVCDAGLAAAGAACSLEDEAGWFGMGTSAMVGKAFKLAGGVLPGANKLPGRETGMAGVVLADGAL